ncbi:MAG: hypothetical protein R3B06_10650 [Kofleriaceae bacterium]
MKSFPSGPRSGRRPRRRRWAFPAGAAIAALLLIPLISLTLLAIRGGLSDPVATTGAVAVIRLVAVFAGIPIALTGGGIARLAAEAGQARGRRRAAVVGARTLAVAGAGLMIVAAIPNEVIPASAVGWVALAAAGAGLGAVVGAAVGIVVGDAWPSWAELNPWHDEHPTAP